jgi:RNA polymerase sigma-70 factor (ECF subfamily)
MGGIQRDEAFEFAFRDLHPRARRLALRIVGEPAVADEIASEALARAFADWKKLRSVDYLDAWVLRVTTNLALHVAMRRKVRLLPPPPLEPQDGVAVRMGLVAALRRLPARQREAVALRYLADMSEDDVARSLGVSAGTVKQHVHRGLASLRALLGDENEVEIEEVARVSVAH